MSDKLINLTLKVWRQSNSTDKGQFETYEAKDISTDASFLEMLDIVNERLEIEGKEPIAFDHDCREGICGMCGCMVNGESHGPEKGTTLCQTHMRIFNDGEVIVIEPFRAKSFPVLKDLIVDRSAFDRIIANGGYVSVKTGSPQDANSILITKEKVDLAMDASSCIGCGACVASCPNASAMLFVGVKVSQFALLPQGQIEREQRVMKMVKQMDKDGFGNCSNEYECSVDCPKEIDVSHIARMNWEFIRAYFCKPPA